MNSKQVNFFLTQVDQANLLNQFRAKRDFVVVRSRAQDGHLSLLDSAEVKEMGIEALQVHLARPVDLEAIQLNLVPNQPYMTINVLKSPVIEFDRCYQADGILRRGRLYFVTAYYSAGTLIRKEEAFLNWASDLLTLTRRNLTKEPGSSFYLGADAFRAKESGTKLGEF
jgi:hypothetical protein